MSFLLAYWVANKLDTKFKVNFSHFKANPKFQISVGSSTPRARCCRYQPRTSSWTGLWAWRATNQKPKWITELSSAGGITNSAGRPFPAFSTSFPQVRFQLNCSRELNMADPCLKDYITDLKQSFGLQRVYDVKYGGIHVNLGKLTSYTLNSPKLRFGYVP